ncbi:uncharacterized protein LOC111316370 [Durio zibethinus]|uniref:Uncharacterized protein LOC111316370 n=1 Tax=Durio zibethinus TaxID=66656 RepID=A0A6P6BAF5_DURZI|nr:uncharacterized protein LOC111316370 [Durio zibethinus]
MCPRCGQEEETIMHVIKRCPPACEVWKMECWGDKWKRADLDSEKGWLSSMWEAEDRSNMEMGLTVCWVLWNNRNEEIRINPGRTTDEVMAYARSYLEEYLATQKRSDTQTTHENIKWRSAEAGYANANFDGEHKMEESVDGAGAIERDAAGKVLRACSCRIAQVNDPSVAEALAMNKAIIFSRQLGLQSVIVEGDSLEVLN